MIYVYDRSFNKIDTIDLYTSYINRIRYNDLGEFELHIEKDAFTSKSCINGNIVKHELSDYMGIINHKKDYINDAGVNMILIKGNFLDEYVSRRIIWGNYNFVNTAVDDAVNTLLDTQLINPSDTKRKINFKFIKKGFTEKINTQVSYKNLLETIQDMLKSKNLGHRCLYNRLEDKIHFEIYKGLDRTSMQKLNDQCIFSKEFDNILSQEYTLNTIDHKNIALVAGEGEGSARKIVTVGNTSASGIDRKELYVDARDLQKESNTDLQYTEILKERGNLKLLENDIVESFDARINVNSNMIYKVNYDVGDIVTFKDPDLETEIFHKRIMEIEEIFENFIKINVIFGEEEKTISQKIKKGAF